MEKPAATRASRRRAKRPRTHDACSCCSSQIPLRGAKQRSAIRLRTLLRRGGEAAAAVLVYWRDWANLGEGPAGLIAERVLANDVVDYIRFLSVCQPWRHCCAAPPADDALDRLFHPRQWIILHEKLLSHYRCRLLNLSTGECIRMHLPELRGHKALRPSTEGLVLLLHESTHVARLLNPLTHQVTELPPVTTFLDHLQPLGGSVDRLNVEGINAGLADDRTVVIHTPEILAVAKPGDNCWTAVNLSACLLPMSFAGRFYGV
ncbi:hypothetical protein E2562_008905 [Oryza meyeriana var. granulata]|uniref:KIB1-4 beta-propeller domain-containing protein n=1 Tax=Oryza meyeriana var. granulata TaxID=110450 RepID=A0A6G1D132_9ORYZ|nr:hypothetical protein E2562_008905 [Oryza meyeriana var. granulata]